VNNYVVQTNRNKHSCVELTANLKCAITRGEARHEESRAEEEKLGSRKIRSVGRENGNEKKTTES